MAAPLGVLKTGSIAFTPKLPDWKQSAISDLGVGHENKVGGKFLYRLNLVRCMFSDRRRMRRPQLRERP
jgi:hypothetical protein